MFPLTRTLGLCARLVVIVPFVASCSTSYKATRVQTKQVSVNKPGIYYSLPKTQLLVTLNVKKVTKSAGIYAGDVWENCEKLCYSDDTTAKCPLFPVSPATTPKPAESYELSNVKTFSRVIADPAHLYHVEVDLGSFVAFSHTFKLTNEGVLSSSSSEIENKSAEAAINTFKAVAKLVTTAKGYRAYATLTPTNRSQQECIDFDALHRKQEKLTQQVEDLRKQLDAVLFSSHTPSGPAVEQLIKRHEERVRELKAKDEFKVLVAARSQSSEEKELGIYAVLIDPAEFTSASAAASDWKPIQQVDAAGFAGLEAKPAEESAIAAVQKELVAKKVTVAIKPEIPFTAADNGDTAAPAKETGYRYRFPVAAKVEVLVDKTVIGNARPMVAQYGAVVAMPSKISGVKSKIVLDLYEGTGSPRQVDVGATPAPTTIVGDALAPIQDELDRRKKAKEDAKKEAEAAEANELTKQRDILKLKKEIGELETAIKNQENDATEEVGTP